MASSKAFQQEVQRLAEGLRQRIEAEVAGFSADPKKAANRSARAKQNFRYFCKTYFPHYISRHDSVLHTWLYNRLPSLVADKRGIKLAVAAPRGEAKSTLVTQLFVLWCVLTERKHFIPIIMNGYEQAAIMLEAIKAELEANPRLRQDFAAQVGAGPVWQAGVIVTTNTIKIQAFGAGKLMRGLRHGPYRPDMVICDDLENDENVRSRTQRDKLERWFRNAVLRLGPADDSMDAIVIGTVLHHDSLLSRLLNNPLWEQERFRAVITWPNDMTLWEAWEVVFMAEGELAADSFYRRNKKAMDAGASISWPRVRTLEILMKIRARDGRDAFDAELQNQPLSANAIFANLQYWQDEDSEWLFFGAVDPSMGKSGGRGDPSAILVGGFNRKNGVLSVVDADIQRRTPDKIIGAVIEKQRLFGCRLWIVETVQFQEFFKDELVKRSAIAGVPVPARGVKPTGDKELRISSLQPHIANGLILLHATQKTLIDQLLHWGEGDCHDDGPDALQMLWMGATGGVVMSGFQSTGRRSVNERMDGFCGSAGGNINLGGSGIGSVSGRLGGMNGYG